MSIRVNIDSLEDSISPDPNRTIGELIGDISVKLPSNRIVTSINLDGNRLLMQEHKNILAKKSDSLSQINIQTVDREIWAATGLDICQSCVDRVQGSFATVSELFREQDTLKANRLFVHCIEGLERFIESISITRIALKMDFSLLLSPEGYKLSELEDNLNHILAAILTFQEEKNYFEIAEKIEYELLPNLVSWRTSLGILRNSQLSNA